MTDTLHTVGVLLLIAAVVACVLLGFSVGMKLAVQIALGGAVASWLLITATFPATNNYYGVRSLIAESFIYGSVPVFFAVSMYAGWLAAGAAAAFAVAIGGALAAGDRKKS